MSSSDHVPRRPAPSQAAEGDNASPAASLQLAAKALRTAEHVCVLTGAGISAESGIPTFRDALTGLWSRYDARDLATPEAFLRHPDVVWSWYAMRAALARAAKPNAGHYAVATIGEHAPHLTLVTQNVDDLHARAGSHAILQLHGNLLEARCSAGCDGTIAFADAPQDRAPACARCGALMRPDVVWFGESLAPATLATARAVTVACDVFLSIGTSNVVEPAASLPWLAASHGATVIIVNADMRGQRHGPSILQLQGLAGQTMSELVSVAFAGRRVRYRSE